MDLNVLDAPIAHLNGVMLSDLVAMSNLLDAQSDTIKRRKEALHALLARRFEEDARKQLVAGGKDTGTVNLETNGITVKVVFAKKVEWDQGALMAALNAMNPDDAKHYAKVELKVDERKYTAAPPAVQAALSPARTVKVDKPKFSFAIADKEAA